MKTFPDLIVCEHCDSVYQRPAPAAGEHAYCETCEAVLYRASYLGLDHWLALTVAAAIAFVIANFSPIVSISLQGLHNSATLWQAAGALAQGPIALIAVPTALSIIVVPFMQICLLGWVLAHLRFGRRPPGLAPAIRILSALRPWSMVEVGLLGILVAVIKLTSLVEVHPGAGIWAMAALMVLMTLIANRDAHQLWEMAEQNAPRRETRA